MLRNYLVFLLGSCSSLLFAVSKDDFYFADIFSKCEFVVVFLREEFVLLNTYAQLKIV